MKYYFLIRNMYLYTQKKHEKSQRYSHYHLSGGLA